MAELPAPGAVRGYQAEGKVYHPADVTIIREPAPEPGPQPEAERRYVVVLTTSAGREHLSHTTLLTHREACGEAGWWRESGRQADVREVT